MPAESLDHATIRAFWERRSREGRTRWTPAAMLEYELAWLRAIVPPGRPVLDLGSGHGELSRPLASGSRLVAVDFAPGYGASFTEPGHEFVESSVQAFDTSERFGAVLLFGVVTALEEADELPLYRRIGGWLEDGGVAIVKNQCAVDEQFVVSGYSEELGADYSGRYPTAAEQGARLREAFATVEVRPYPPELNRWETSAHVGFACREPRVR